MAPSSPWAHGMSRERVGSGGVPWPWEIFNWGNHGISMGNNMGIINFSGITLGIYVFFLKKTGNHIGYQWEIYGILAGFITNQLRSAG